MDTKILSFNSMVSDYEIVNPEFARVKVYVCYDGKNRNNSYIEKDVLQKMSNTIYGIPMVAEYDEDNNCFKGHGGKLEISDEGIEFKQTTVPYGFVDPKTPIFYDEVMELDGITKHNYLCCYAYLWYKRYPEVENVLRNQDNKKIGQSMEINVTSYDIDEDGCCIIKDGYFSALAMLGVEPCFESACVTSKFSKESDSIWEEMILSFKKYTKNDKEGSIMDKEYENEELDVTEELNEEEFKKKKCAEDEEDFKKKKCEEDKDDKDDVDDVEEDKEDKDKDDFKKKKCTEDEEDEFKKKKCENEEEDEFKKKKCSEDEEDFKKKKCAEEEDYQAKYEEVNSELISLKAQYSDLQAEYEDLKTKYTALESEVAELRDFALEENVFSKFEVLKNVEGYEEIYNARFELSEEDLVLRLKALAYDNGIIMNKKNNRREKEIKKFSLDVNNQKNKGKVTEWDTLNLNKK